MKEQIARKAAELFNLFSVKSVTMDEIASKMGISKKTLYIWFTDKNELVETVYLRPLKLAEKECLAGIAQARDAIQEAFVCWHKLNGVLDMMNETLLHDLQKYHHSVFESYVQFKKGFLYKLIFENIERGKAELLYRANINTEIIAHHQVAVMDINHSPLLFNNRAWPAAVIGEQLMLHYLYGLATGKGLKLIEKRLAGLSEKSNSR